MNLDAVAVLNAGWLKIQRRARVVIPMMQELVGRTLSESRSRKQNGQRKEIFYASHF